VIFEVTGDVSDPKHWLQTASPQEKRDRILNAIGGIPAELREIFEQTPVKGIRPESHVWRDIELDSLPVGRVVLVGDAAHAMTPFRGEAGYHTLIDTLLLGNIFGDMNTGAKFKDPAAVEEIIAGYNKEMLQRGRKAVRESRNLHGNAGRVGPDGKPLVMEMMSDMEIKLGIDG
jgi:2-polyprenyl-6-methoxyphenol hydroxylase-like FAD-dependent oxidoreductase